MGPSGAGKDSVLRYARANLDRREKIVFAHRYITRPADASGENHIALTHAEFATRKAAGLFAFDWQAHDTCYGIGIEVRTWRERGLTVVINGSREHFCELKPEPKTIVPVMITAPAEILAQRLAGRGRETEAQILSRLQRTPETPDNLATIVIDNSNELEIAGRRFVEVLRSLARAKIEA
jgi:ribose 1,5-bisphosphokinase